MKLQLPDSFLASGRSGLSSIMISLRNYLELYHDHSENVIGNIQAAEIPSGLVNAHVHPRSITTNLLQPTVLQDIAAGSTSFSVDTTDPDLEITLNVGVDYRAILMYSNAGVYTGSSNIFFHFDGVSDTNNFQNNLFGGVSAMRIVDFTAGVHVITVRYGTAVSTIVDGPRVLSAWVFAR